MPPRIRDIILYCTVRFNRAYENHTISGMTDTTTQDTRSAHNVENQGQETTDPQGGNTEWHHDEPTCEWLKMKR
jgi:hypothetical protein